MSRHLARWERAPEGRDTGRPRWAIGWRKQFDLVRTDDGRTYLTRWWLLATPWFGIPVHRMLTGDARDTVHDHPFAFLSIVLRGGYTEISRHPRTLELEQRHVRRLNVMRTRRAHTITHLDRTPTWTLLLVGRQQASWGFWEVPAAPITDGIDNLAHWQWTRHDAFDSGHYVP